MVAVVEGVRYKVAFAYGQHCWDERVTYCFLKEGEGENVVGYGVASCAPGDNFNKVIGRKLALARALKDAGLNKAERTAIWEQFKASHKFVA